MKSIFFALLALAISSDAFGGAGCSKSGCNALIEKLYIESSGRVLIATAGDERAANCTPVSNIYLSLSPSHKGFDQIYSALLTYQALGKPVFLRITEGSNACNVSYVTLE